MISRESVWCEHASVPGGMSMALLLNLRRPAPTHRSSRIREMGCRDGLHRRRAPAAFGVGRLGPVEVAALFSGTRRYSTSLSMTLVSWSVLVCAVMLRRWAVLDGCSLVQRLLNLARYSYLWMLNCEPKANFIRLNKVWKVVSNQACPRVPSYMVIELNPMFNWHWHPYSNVEQPTALQHIQYWLYVLT